MNHQSQKLFPHEIAAMKADPKVIERLVKSYEMVCVLAMNHWSIPPSAFLVLDVFFSPVFLFPRLDRSLAIGSQLLGFPSQGPCNRRGGAP